MMAQLYARFAAQTPRGQFFSGCIMVVGLTALCLYGLGFGSFLIRPYLFDPSVGLTTVIPRPTQPLPATPTQQPPPTFALPSNTLVATPTQAPIPTRAPTRTPTPTEIPTLPPGVTATAPAEITLAETPQPTEPGATPAPKPKRTRKATKVPGTETP